MLPAIRPGDWLLVAPVLGGWPRPGAVAVFRSPADGELSVKRVAAGPGEHVPFADGHLRLGDGEAWLLSDADETLTAAAGHGPPVDSRRFGPVPRDLLVGRVAWRYGPSGRFGRVR